MPPSVSYHNHFSWRMSCPLQGKFLQLKGQVCYKAHQPAYCSGQTGAKDMGQELNHTMLFRNKFLPIPRKQVNNKVLEILTSLQPTDRLPNNPLSMRHPNILGE